MMRHCMWGSVVVGLRQWLPTLPSRYSWTSRIGCNNLACHACGHPVRRAVGLAISTVSDSGPSVSAADDGADGDKEDGLQGMVGGGISSGIGDGQQVGEQRV